MLSPDKQQARVAIPVQVYGSTLGFTGLTLALERAQTAFGIASFWSLLLLGFTSLLILLLTLLMAWQYGRGTSTLASAWQNPSQAVAFSGFTLSLVLLGAAWREQLPALAMYLWMLGMCLHVLLCFSLVQRWFAHGVALSDVSPAWFVPMVGNGVITIHAEHFFSAELGWYFFALAAGSWLILQPLVLYCLIVKSLAQKAKPTAFILVAPPAVLFLAYFSLTSEVDALGRVLFNFSLFWLLFFLCCGRRVIDLSFDLTAWSFTFPFSAFLMAYIEYMASLELLTTPAYQYLGLSLLILLCLIVALVACLSLLRVIRWQVYKTVTF